MHSGIGLNNKIMKSSRFLGVFSAGIICFGGGLLQAQTTAGLIDVDFNGNSISTAYNGGGPDPGPTQSGAVLIGSTGDIWNGFSDSDLGFTTTPNTPGPISASGLALNYANGSSSGVLMSLTASSSYDAQSFGNHSPFVTAGSPYQNLMQDLLVANSLETVTLSGLAPNATFNLILYNAGDNNVGAGRTSTFAVNGVTQTSDWDGATSTLVAGVDYVNYSSVTSDGSGNLVIDYGLSSGGESDLDGFQLLAVPEPSTWAMLAAGGVMLLGYRRGFRRA
jgi:hypothetical protein